MKELFTPRLHLRYITEADTPRIFSCWASDPEVSRFVSWNTHQSISDTEAYVSFIMNEYKKSDCYRWGIELGDTGELIGIIDVVGYDEGMPVIGYCSGKAYWGRGFMTEALKAVTALLFEEGFEVLKIEAVNKNIGSNRVIEKAGFELVGIRTERFEQKNAVFTINSYRLYKSK